MNLTKTQTQMLDIIKAQFQRAYDEKLLQFAEELDIDIEDIKSGKIRFNDNEQKFFVVNQEADQVAV